MNKRNLAKVIVVGTALLLAPIEVPVNLIRCAVLKTSPARMFKSSVDLMEILLTPDFTISTGKIGRKEVIIATSEKAGKKIYYY